MLFDIMDIRKRVQKLINEERYYHSLGVSFTACALAMRYGGDLRRTEVAGLLHDCAKDLTLAQMVKCCESMGQPISDLESGQVRLLHSKAGAAMAAKDFAIDDAEILNAIRYHTTGRPRMTLMEKIIYIADAIEPDRGDMSHKNEIRAAVFEDLDKGLLMILHDTIIKLKSENMPIDLTTARTYEYYSQLS